MSTSDVLGPGAAGEGDEGRLPVPSPLGSAAIPQQPDSASRIGPAPITLYDVARMAGVSIATVSRVVHGQDRVRESTRARVREVIEHLGYVPDGDAQSLSRRRKNVIGEVIVPPTDLARLADRLPIVVVAGDPAEQDVDVVTADNRSGAAALVNHLVDDHGRRRLFHVDGPPSAPDAKERRLALLDVLHTHPGVELIGSHTGRFSVESGEVAGVKLLANRKTLPDAVVCANDQMAIGVLQALARGGVRVPEDVAVTGFDDIFPGGLSEPSLTTVHQPMRLLGERACARLLNRIARPEIPPEVELLPTDLVLRRSCGCPPGPGARRTLAPLREASGEVASHVSRGRRHARAKSES